MSRLVSASAFEVEALHTSDRKKQLTLKLGKTEYDNKLEKRTFLHVRINKCHILCSHRKKKQGHFQQIQ